MPQVRGQSFGELQYIALNLIESTITKLEWDGFYDAVRIFTQSDEDARTVLQLIEQAAIVVGFDQGDEEGE